MGLTQRNRAEITKYLQNYAKRIEEALVYILEAFVEELINHAKSSAGYVDRTSNLKSSIGGYVVKDGRVITHRGFVNEKGASEGAQTGLEFINSLLAQHSKGYGIIIVAGMNYASYVENLYGLNVLKKTELKAGSEFKRVLDRLKIQIDRAA